ncbi:MAG: radical SAM protein [Planctomycetales bacterium]|nr:radical SAM protein [Planctomycetales bacterium]
MSAESNQLFRQHERLFESNRFVYPVVSRRSGGVSIGVNLNPDKVCNFDCIYCQVNRRSEATTRFVETDALLAELDQMLDLATSGKLFETTKFAATPVALRRVNDIAFSGDGEPTTYRNFDEIITASADVKRRHGLDGVKMVLITNASMFHRPHVKRGLAVLDANNGEIWAKLDAGSEAYYQLIERTTIPFHRILTNITAAAQVRPLVIQSLFMRVDGDGPSDDELAAFCDRLNEVTTAGGMLSLVQVYTVARPPAESNVSALPDAEVDRIVAMVRSRTSLPAQAFYGVAADD